MTCTVFTIASLLLLSATQGEANCPKQYYPSSDVLPPQHDSVRCKLKVKTCPKVQLETKCGTYTHQFSQDTYFGFRCENNGNACESNHLPFQSGLVTYRMCAPRTTNTVVVAVTHSVDSCTDTVNVRYENITACGCKAAGTANT